MIENRDCLVTSATRQTVGQSFNKPLVPGSRKSSATQLNAVSRNHVVLDSFQKLQLLEEYKRIQETGDIASLSELADWAKEKFRLKKLPSKATISRIVDNETKIKNDVENQKFKNRRGTDVKFPEFEKLLVQWLWTMFDENTCVIDELIREKASEL